MISLVTKFRRISLVTKLQRISLMTKLERISLMTKLQRIPLMTNLQRISLMTKLPRIPPAWRRDRSVTEGCFPVGVPIAISSEIGTFANRLSVFRNGYPSRFGIAAGSVQPANPATKPEKRFPCVFMWFPCFFMWFDRTRNFRLYSNGATFGCNQNG